MKKFLSLVLALVMTMSLVTVSAGAKDFTDDDKITYEEAVNVISTIGVVDGYTDGSFNPQGSLTRGAAAKIICNMILGPTTAAELRADTAPFKDVPTNHTFAGYIAYCAKEGIISGYADGTFRPAGSLTGYAFMKMLLGALGYDSAIEGYTGANWSINVAKKAINIGLNKSLEGEFNGVKAVNREEAALYAFNTLKADLVEYSNKTQVTVGGATVVIDGTEAKAQKWNNSATKINNIKKDDYIQFAEQYFTKLVLEETEDAFGRPSRNWEFKGKDIGTYLNHDLLVEEYTTKVTGKDLYDLLGKTTIEDYDTTVYIDGVSDVKVDEAIFTAADMNKNNKEKVGATGDGVLTQVFVDSDKKDITVAIINTYLAIADSDYSEKKEEASFSVYGLEKKTVKNGFEYVKADTANEDVVKTVKASIDDFAVEDVEKDDAYLVNVAEGEIQILNKAEVIEDTEITAFKKGSNVTTGGTKYDYADTAEYDWEVLDKYTSTTTGTVNLKDVTYNVYLDAYGYAIGVDVVEAADNYVFITGIDLKNSSLGNKTAEAGAIFIDGTMKVIDVNMTKSTLDVTTNPTALINSWCTYTVNKDGVYTLTEVTKAVDGTTVPGGSANSKKIAQAHEIVASTTASRKDTMPIDKKNISLSGGPASGNFKRVYGNDSSVYLTVELAEIKENGTNYGIIDDVASVTTGVKNANLNVWETDYAQDEAEDAKVSGNVAAGNFAQGVYTLYKNNGYVIAAVVVGDDGAAAKNLVYTHKKDVEQESYDKTTDEWTWTRKVVYQGEEIELKEVSDSSTYLEGMSQYTWYQVKLNAKDEVIGVELASSALVHDTPFADGTANAWEYIEEAIDVEKSVNKYDTVLYHEGIQHNKPTMKGSTLYAKTSDDTGFFVDEDVKIVLTQYNKNKVETTFETGSDTLEDIIDALNKKHDDQTYNYTISAILDEGAAIVVVIKDDSNSYDAPVTSTGDGVEESAVVQSLTPNALTGVINVIDRVGVEKTPLELSIEALEKAFYDYQYQNGDGTLVALKGDRLYTFTMNVDKAYQVALAVDASVAGFVDKLTPTKLWVCQNTATVFTVKLDASAAPAGFSAGDAAAETSGLFTVAWETAPTGGEKALDVEIQFSGAPAAGKTATFKWTW